MRFLLVREKGRGSPPPGRSCWKRRGAAGAARRGRVSSSELGAGSAVPQLPGGAVRAEQGLRQCPVPAVVPGETRASAPCPGHVPLPSAPRERARQLRQRRVSHLYLA